MPTIFGAIGRTIFTPGATALSRSAENSAIAGMTRNLPAIANKGTLTMKGVTETVQTIAAHAILAVEGDQDVISGARRYTVTQRRDLRTMTDNADAQVADIKLATAAIKQQTKVVQAVQGYGTAAVGLIEASVGAAIEVSGAAAEAGFEAVTEAEKVSLKWNPAAFGY
jgi:hypothetical protein